MNVTLKQLQVFRAVAAEKNFRRAGELVGLTQPAVSRAITELEGQINLRLFDRTTREVRLTQAGVILAQRLPRWMDELDNTLNEIHSWASARTGKVRVASSPTLSAALVPHCLSYCAQQEPGLQVILFDRVQQDVLNGVLSGEVDFGLIVEPDAARLSELHHETLLTDPFVVVCPEHHALARQAEKRGLDWRNLGEHDLILLDQASGSRRLIDELIATHQIASRIVQEVGHVTTGFEMVRAGLGINIVPGLAVPETGLPGLKVICPRPLSQRKIMLARPRNKTLAPLAETLWSLVRASTEATMRRRDASKLIEAS
ncbi:LysR family transcriptional regulator [Pusillimonas caeni]|uniref:LysR family transcriptional regulator n=1 Tax=Pusillimonas caeni TaxID=1348472 RepID=UPI000E59D3F2|nr:LysR family transcriptional regulator [Pusillimonas caeni]TFL14818.1 LysR family transcriptional regulator [Pusillimonas caeni]